MKRYSPVMTENQAAIITMESAFFKVAQTGQTCNKTKVMVIAFFNYEGAVHPQYTPQSMA
jgi:hypothetical protein